MLLCRHGSVKLDDAEFIDFVAKEEGGVEAFVETLTKTQLIAVQDRNLVLTTLKCQVVVTPAGVFAGENHDGQLTAWLNKQLQALRAK